MCYCSAALGAAKKKCERDRIGGHHKRDHGLDFWFSDRISLFFFFFLGWTFDERLPDPINWDMVQCQNELDHSKHIFYLGNCCIFTFNYIIQVS